MKACHAVHVFVISLETHFLMNQTFVHLLSSDRVNILKSQFSFLENKMDVDTYLFWLCDD